MSKKLPYPIVEVLWVDSEHDAGWSTLTEVLEEQTKPLECRSCGFLIADKEDRIVLATSIGAVTGEDDEQVSAYLVIPKRAILWQKELTYKTPRKKKIIGIQEQQ